MKINTLPNWAWLQQTNIPPPRLPVQIESFARNSTVNGWCARVNSNIFDADGVEQTVKMHSIHAPVLLKTEPRVYQAKAACSRHHTQPYEWVTTRIVSVHMNLIWYPCFGHPIKCRSMPFSHNNISLATEKVEILRSNPYHIQSVVWSLSIFLLFECFLRPSSILVFRFFFLLLILVVLALPFFQYNRSNSVQFGFFLPLPACRCRCLPAVVAAASNRRERKH